MSIDSVLVHGAVHDVVDDNGSVAAQFGVSSIPTLVLLRNGKEVQRIIGFKPKDVLKEVIDKA